MELEFILEVIGKVLAFALVALLGMAWSYVSKWLENKVVREIVADGVRYAQKVYGHLGGHEKYDYALAKIIVELEARGIKIDADRLKMFIESILVELKKEFDELWYKL